MLAAPERRLDNADALQPVLQGAFLSRASQEWVRIFAQCGVPCGLVQEPNEVFDDPQVNAGAHYKRSNKMSLRTSLCDLLGCRYPVMLAGMGGIARVTNPELVAAVSDAGGFGVLGAISREPDDIRACVGRIRELTDQPFGVGIALPAVLAKSGANWEQTERQIEIDYPGHAAFVRELLVRFKLPPTERQPGVLWGSLSREQLAVVLEERVPLLAAALGDATAAVPLAHEAGTKVLGMAGSVANALRQKQAGVDVIVSQGSEAGGHTGRISTMPLLPAVVDAVAPCPVVAAGGIADGRGVVAALALGAVGVWMGTAFLAAREADIPEVHWKQLASGSAEAFTVSRAYTGKTARGFQNEIKDAWDKSGLAPLPMPLQSVLMKPLIDAALAAGRWDLVVNHAGQVAGSLTERRPAREIVERVVSQAAQVLQRLARQALAGAQRA